jgi:DNA-binding transcriptional regulator LsrR (DeoR family)
MKQDMREHPRTDALGTPRTPSGASAPKPAALAGTDSQKKTKKKKETTFSRKRRRRLQELVDNYELVSFVCHRHIDGWTSKQIQNLANKKFPRADLKREDPNYIIRWAAQEEWFDFRPPLHQYYCGEIHKHWPLQDVRVVGSTEVDVVAREGARMLMHMLRLHRKRKTVHVGVAGGHTIRALMRGLAVEMVEPYSNMPEVVHFHALAAGFDPEDPSTDPNAFVTFFHDKLISTSIRFTGLSAPAIVNSEMFVKLQKFGDIQKAFNFVKNLDIFVTAGTSWHEHSVLLKRLEPADQAVLEAEGVLGDILWRPISKRGPILAETDRRAFTLIELSQLSGFVQEGKQVLLVLAPCGLCGELKGGMSSPILDQGLITHLVIDTLSAGQLCEISGVATRSQQRKRATIDDHGPENAD